ncbi:monooxygenase [Lentzea sp. NBRC 105346]|uniref:LLM class flavin-dependent oxidoreductase n=1 Tax=Lentzea sp. NBRC 105346 TaxID=3032205 RepID=UPI0024A1E5D8|nr:LLM class flavin-dependent oxidoreductase [Lentzea sp. NBRC 105346]GLZ32243.1 monooxygenase [Lentzea sp. NBRC 105346]
MTLRFGAFVSPLHPPGEDPTLSLDRDLELAQHLDRLGFAEYWVGEHHSSGWGTVLSPELFVATAAERTRHIRIGTGVVSLPYHNPYMVASRFVQLDHLTRGRAMFGMGAGSSPADMYMIGVDPAETRRMTAEALQAVHHLMTSDEPLTMETDWFTLNEASLQLRPYSSAPDLAISSARTPNSMRLAGRYGISPISFGAPIPGMPRVDLAAQWRHAEEGAAEHGNNIGRSSWRITMPMHVAETTQEAMDDVRAGLKDVAHGYFRDTLGIPVNLAGKDIEDIVADGDAIVGSVDDCVIAIQRLLEETGGFGTLLVTVRDWTSWEKTLRSFDLLARYVAPHFSGSTARVHRSSDWVKSKQSHFVAQAKAAKASA